MANLTGRNDSGRKQSGRKEVEHAKFLSLKARAVGFTVTWVYESILETYYQNDRTPCGMVMTSYSKKTHVFRQEVATHSAPTLWDDTGQTGGDRITHTEVFMNNSIEKREVL